MSPKFARVRRVAFVALACYGLLLGLILHTPLADWMVRPLVVWPAPQPGNAIVVLAAWATPNRILNEEGVWRTLEAARMYRKGLAPTILISGGGNSPAAMGDLLREVGIPPSAVEFELASEDTHESAVNVGRLARSRGWKGVVLVTDAKHMARATGAFAREGVHVSPAPSMMWEMWWDRPYDRYRKLHGAIHEYGGLLYYWWRGWI